MKWEEMRLIFVGRLIERKRLLDLLQSILDVRDSGLRVRLTVVGDGPCFHSARRFVYENGLSEVVALLGAIPHTSTADLMKEADALVLPAESEPWGVVVAEAAACGLALILSDEIGAGADLLRDGQNGYSFPAGDVVALSRSIELLYRRKSKGDMSRLGDMSRQLAEAFSFENCVRSYWAAMRVAAKQTV